MKSSPEQAEIDALQTSDHLLKGLLFDDAGHRMIATHATKAGVRHRYYVSKPALHGEARIAKLGSVSRVPPSEIEGSSKAPYVLPERLSPVKFSVLATGWALLSSSDRSFRC
ncbi:MAG: hypothetical protein WBZ25_09640 [Pseudolabrys sp.]